MQGKWRATPSSVWDCLLDILIRGKNSLCLKLECAEVRPETTWFEITTATQLSLSLTLGKKVCQYWHFTCLWRSRASYHISFRIYKDRLSRHFMYRELWLESVNTDSPKNTTNNLVYSGGLMKAVDLQWANLKFYSSASMVASSTNAQVGSSSFYKICRYSLASHMKAISMTLALFYNTESKGRLLHDNPKSKAKKYHVKVHI